MSEKLEELRLRIDQLDATWLSILGSRFAVTQDVGKFKAGEDLPAVDLERENAQLEHMEILANEMGVPRGLASGILRLIIDEVVFQHQLHRQEEKTHE